MKVELTPKLTNKKMKIESPNTNFLSKVKLFFTSKTTQIPNDSFEKDNQEQTEQAERLVPRKYPNWCEYDEDYRSVASVPAQTICYYPEDEERMEQMTEDEMVKYKDKLCKEGKYTYAKPMTREDKARICILWK